MKKLLIRASAFNLVLVGLFMIFGQSASAVVTLSPDPGSIPTDIRNYMESADSRPNSPSLIGWVAEQGSPAQQSLNVVSGTASINLTYHSIGTVGFKPSSTTKTRYYVESASAGVSGIDGKYNELVFSPDQNTVGATRTDSTDFNYAPAGGFTTSGSYFVELNTRIINEFSNGSFYRCVANGAKASSLSSYGACPETKQVFEIYVTVSPVIIDGCTDSTATNYSSAATVDDGSCVYPVPGCTDSSATNYNSGANTDDGSCVYDLCSNLSGVQQAIPSGYSSDGSGGCVYPAPSCGPSNDFSVPAGLSFTTKKSFKNDNSIDMPVSNATYSIGAVVPASSAIPTSATIAPGGSSEFTTSAHTINSPGLYTITWTLTYDFGTKDCSDTVTVTVVEPGCSVEKLSIGTRDKFVPRVTIENSNYVELNITKATYVTSPAKISGSATPGPAPGRINTTYDAAETSIDTPGEYLLTWTVLWSVGSSSGSVDCGPKDIDGDGNPDPNVLVSDQPYARFYGGDLFAGGGFGNSCEGSGADDALGFGKFSGGSYLGTASELAVFAVGQIQNVLPGAQRSRTSLQELAFANVDSGSIQVDPVSGKFGGGFGSIACGPDYFADAPVDNKKLETTVDLSSLVSGSYLYGSGMGSTTSFSTGAGVPDGRRLIVYVDGNVEIKNSGNSRFGFANALGNWVSFSDVPSLYIIASGNIYVQKDITTMDGVYVAQPRFKADDTTGNIYSCARGTDNPLFDLGNKSAGGNAEFILNDCNSKLTVNGAFMAKRVHLIRSMNTVNNGTPYETHLTSKAAEVFRFSPELYLTEGGGLRPRSTNVKIDSIVALPPSF